MLGWETVKLNCLMKDLYRNGNDRLAASKIGNSSLMSNNTLAGNRSFSFFYQKSIEENSEQKQYSIALKSFLNYDRNKCTLAQKSITSMKFSLKFQHKF